MMIPAQSVELCKTNKSGKLGDLLILENIEPMLPSEEDFEEGLLTPIANSEVN